MRKTANGLLRVSGYLGIGGLIGLFLFGCISFFTTDSREVWGGFVISALALFLSILLLILGMWLHSEAEHREFIAFRDAPPRPTIPLVRLDKPDDYNRAVTSAFFNGPELRHKSEDFHHGFAARALVPPPGAKN
ncbi:hypothetical protein [Sphingobium yanoikuyae]|uniref:hypothetical protein n=1 Tax=Sphingobium yanoikuyae TaxID=13690 RepID=UPI0035C71124